jgi:mannose-6-phosphate isomerase-like protein (cupin superfamily)
VAAVDACELDEILARFDPALPAAAYEEFLRVPSLSVGVYRLPAGGEDPQSPHAEDEVYYVIEGRATIRVGEEDRPVRPGSTVFVAARVPHRFHSIEEVLTILVFFAPPESGG